MGADGGRWGKRRRFVRGTVGAVSLLDEEMTDGARSAEGNSALALMAIARDSEKRVTVKGQQDGACLFLEAKKSLTRVPRRITDGYKVQTSNCNMVTRPTRCKKGKGQGLA